MERENWGADWDMNAGRVRTLRGDLCVIHRYHWPKPQRTVRHHCWPKEYGGPDVEENLINLCDTGHYNVHTAIEDLRRGRVPKGTRKELALAQYAMSCTRANVLLPLPFEVK